MSTSPTGLARRRQRRRTPPHSDVRGPELAALTLTALGVVFGDIGTSPLYAFKECFKPEYGLAPTPAAVYGLLSLIVWALILIVSVKYVALILRLDNHGEGGILALLALNLSALTGARYAARRRVLVALGLFGAALLYGDGVITPAISVLSAVEGLSVATPVFTPWVVPLALVILFALFLVQRTGTARVGGIFGPVMLAWFIAIGLLGAMEIADAPAILAALNPWYGVQLFVEHGRAAFLALGAVVLAVTGAEALYADLGHFGRRPIRLAWFTVVLPALLLNYFGQGALVLRTPGAVENPFYLLAPRALLYPLVVLATVATVVASQALITGAFSLTHQAIQLRLCPRLTVVHTSRAEAGQIYIPEVNTALMLGCLYLVYYFQTSSALGAAYGVAVTGTMAITTTLLYAVARDRWRWSPLRAGAVAGGFIAIDLALFGANVIKIEHGGWVSLVMASAIYLLMSTWKRGQELLTRLLSAGSMPLEEFIAVVDRLDPPRVKGTAVFLTPTLEGAPPLLIHHLRRNKVLHEHVIILSIVTDVVPEVPDDERVETERLAEGFYRVRATYGFMERPNAEDVVAECCERGLASAEEDATYYLGRATLLPTGRAPMMRWRKQLFAFMARNASNATDFFGIPPEQVVELGARIKL